MAVAIRAKLWRWVVSGLLIVVGSIAAYFAAAIAWIWRGSLRDRDRFARLFDTPHTESLPMRQALEAAPCTEGDEPRAWQTAVACERPAASHATVPPSSRVAVGR